MNSFIKDTSLYRELPVGKIYPSVACMNADISNILSNEVVFTERTIYQKQNNLMVNIGPQNTGPGDASNIGDIIMYYGNTNPDPTHFLVCNGSTFSSTDFSELYNLLGTNTLPNLNDYSLVGSGTNNSSTIYCHFPLDVGCKRANSLVTHSHNAVATAAHNHSISGGMHCHTYHYNNGTRTIRRCCGSYSNCYILNVAAPEYATCPTDSAGGAACSALWMCCQSCCTCITVGCPASFTGYGNVRYGTTTKPKTKTVMFLMRAK